MKQNVNPKLTMLILINLSVQKDPTELEGAKDSFACKCPEQNWKPNFDCSPFLVYLTDKLIAWFNFFDYTAKCM